MSEITIQNYSPACQQEVVDLILAIQQNEFSVAITLEQQPDLENIPVFYQQGGGNFWVAAIGSKVVGTIALLPIGNNRGALRKMFVHKNFRGKGWGVGQKLLNTLLEWSGQTHLKEIWLGTTEKFIAAQRFYEKNGFVEIDKPSLPEGFPVMDVDVKFYKFIV